MLTEPERRTLQSMKGLLLTCFAIQGPWTCLKKNVDFTLISQILGHSNLSTTLIYARASTEMKRNAAEKANLDDLLVPVEKESKEASDKAFLASFGL